MHKPAEMALFSVCGNLAEGMRWCTWFCLGLTTATNIPMPLHAKAASTTVPFLMQLSMRVLKVSFLNSQEVIAVNQNVTRLLRKRSL